MTLRATYVPSEFPAPVEIRERFRALIKSYSLSRPLNRGTVLSEQQIEIVGELIWHLGAWSDLLNELVMIRRLEVYEDVLKIDRDRLVGSREAIIMAKGLHSLDVLHLYTVSVSATAAA